MAPAKINFEQVPTDELPRAAELAADEGDLVALAAIKSVIDSRVRNFQERLNEAKTVQTAVRLETESMRAGIRLGE